MAKGELDKPFVWDPLLEVLAERGALHEQSYLDHLELSGLYIVRIDGIGVDAGALAQTLDAMRSVCPVIAQGALKTILFEAQCLLSEVVQRQVEMMQGPALLGLPPISKLVH